MNRSTKLEESPLSFLAEIQLHYSNPVRQKDRLKINSSSDAYKILKENWSESIELLEEFVILLLDRSNRILGKYVVSKGGVAGTVVDPKKILAAHSKREQVQLF